MAALVEAIYEDGVLKPLGDLDLREHQHVLLEIRQERATAGASNLSAWQGIYEGLTPEDVAAVEKIALDRGQFFRDQP